MEEKRKGRIDTDYTFWCGGGGDACPVWKRFTGLKKGEAILSAIIKGWRLTRSRGWLCPSCTKKRGEQ